MHHHCDTHKHYPPTIVVVMYLPCPLSALLRLGIKRFHPVPSRFMTGIVVVCLVVAQRQCLAETSAPSSQMLPSSEPSMSVFPTLLQNTGLPSGFPLESSATLNPTLPLSSTAPSAVSTNAIPLDHEEESVQLAVFPTVTACHCDGVNCTIAMPRHMGSVVQICLFSDSLPIVEIEDMIMTAENRTYHPIVEGVANDVTQVTLQGTKAVVRTITVSVFFERMDMSMLEITGRINFSVSSGGAARHRRLSKEPKGVMSTFSSRHMSDDTVLKGEPSSSRKIVLGVALIAACTVMWIVALRFHCCASSTEPMDLDEEVEVETHGNIHDEGCLEAKFDHTTGAEGDRDVNPNGSSSHEEPECTH